MTRANSFQRAPPPGRCFCGRSVRILGTVLPQPFPRPGTLWLCLILCGFCLGCVSRQAVRAESGGLAEHIAMALLLVGKAVLCELQLGGAPLRCTLGLFLPRSARHFRS